MVEKVTMIGQSLLLLGSHFCSPARGSLLRARSDHAKESGNYVSKE